MKQDKQKNKLDEAVEQSNDSCTNDESNVKNSKDQPKEYGGRKDGLDPTRYGDWEKNGRCIDF